jgi:hypothetical protein
MCLMSQVLIETIFLIRLEKNACSNTTLVPFVTFLYIVCIFVTIIIIKKDSVDFDYCFECSKKIHLTF